RSKAPGGGFPPPPPPLCRFLDQRPPDADIAEDVLGQPLQADNAPCEHLLRRIGYTDAARLDALGKKRFGLFEPRRELDALIRRVRGDLAHPRELDSELVPEPFQRIDVDSTQRPGDL